MASVLQKINFTLGRIAGVMIGTAIVDSTDGPDTMVFTVIALKRNRPGREPGSLAFSPHNDGAVRVGRVPSTVLENALFANLVSSTRRCDAQLFWSNLSIAFGAPGNTQSYRAPKVSQVLSTFL